MRAPSTLTSPTCKNERRNKANNEKIVDVDAGTDEKRKKCNHPRQAPKLLVHMDQCCASVLEVKKECDKAANETIDLRIQFAKF